MLVATIAIILVTRVAKLVIAIIAFNMVLAAMVIVAIGATIVRGQRHASSDVPSPCRNFRDSDEF